MSKLEEHPTVIHFREEQAAAEAPEPASPLDADWLHQICLDAGADDVGFVAIDRPEIDDEREEMLKLLPRTKTLISIVCRMHREPIRSPARSVANLEFHHMNDHTNDVARTIVATLDKQGVRALNPAVGFPMEAERFPRKLWVISHKPIAVAAGLGQMGIHRNVIHPKFGNFIVLSTVLMDAEVTQTQQPIDYNPCLECRLCVAACPVGAIGTDGSFHFASCYTHNYREFLGGFTDWVETVADSKNAHAYRDKVPNTESISMWQSLSFGANYKSANCMAVCPAGEDVIAPYLTDRQTHLAETLRPLQKKEEPIYVVPGSDAEAHVAQRFPHKTIRHVGNGLTVQSVRELLDSLCFVFQPQQSDGLDAVYHFAFTGREEIDATIVIRDKTLNVADGHNGKADLHVRADSHTWIKFVNGEQNVIWALLLRKVRLRGPLRLLRAFGRCFPR